MRVLVVEDDMELGSRLQKGLREQGYSVDRANRLSAALTQASTGVYDLLIVDRMLPGGDGLDLLTGIRERGIQSAVIFLTARGDVRDRIAGLDAGADDYLVKPFSFPELLARIRVVSRRGIERQTNVMQLDDLRLDPLQRTVERGGKPIDLSTKEFLLLQFLLSHAGHVVSRSMILEHVWNMTCGGMTNVVDVHITRLRKKIDRDFAKPLIHTMRGVGYVVRAD
ncbi:MAG TPA: response regulator transcription factor [Planctomycetaceae bacterium]|jgi:two-component system OmpR family response regulator